MAYSHVRMKVLAVFYTLVLAVIIFLSDYGDTQFLFFIFAGIPYFDKIVHFFVMGFLSFIVNLVFDAKTTKVFGFNYFLGSLIVLAVVSIEELSQIMVRGRDFEIGDLLSDYAGIIVFGELAKFIINKRKSEEVVTEEI